MNALCIRFDPVAFTAATVCEWALLKDNGQLNKDGSNTLAELAQISRNFATHRVTVIVMGDRVLTTSVEVAAEHASHAKNVLPFLVEERLAQELDDVHIALPQSIGAGSNHVAVASHQDMIQWLEAFYSVGLDVERMVPEFLLVPDHSSSGSANTVKVMLEAERAILQYSEHQGTVVEAEQLEVYINLFFAREGGLNVTDHINDQPSITLIASESDEAGRLQVAELSKKLIAHKVAVVLYSESPFLLQAIAAQAQRATGLNLLQGGYQPQTSSSRSVIWRRVAAIAAVFLVAETAMLLGSGWWFGQKVDVLHQAAVDEYRAIFPEERRVVNPRRQFQSHLNRQQSATFSAEFLHLVQALAEAMPDSATLPIKSLRYDAYGGGLLVDLQTDTIEGLDRYTQKLNSQHVSVELLSANDQGDFVSGRIRLEAI